MSYQMLVPRNGFCPTMGLHIFTTSMVQSSDHALYYSIILTIVLKMLDGIAIFQFRPKNYQKVLGIVV